MRYHSPPDPGQPQRPQRPAKPAGPTDLYLQTSEVNNLMVHYNADHNGIIRFYGTAGEEWGSAPAATTPIPPNDASAC